LGIPGGVESRSGCAAPPSKRSMANARDAAASKSSSLRSWGEVMKPPSRARRLEPSTNASAIVGVVLAKTGAQLGLLHGNGDPSEQPQGSHQKQQSYPRAGPQRHAHVDDHQTDIHGIAAEPIRPAKDER